MKTTFKTNTMRLCASLALIGSVLFTSACSSSDGGNEEKDEFSVLPQISSIAFAADGTTSSPTEFTVKTSYSGWDVDHNEWINVTESDNGFSVSVEPNTGDALTGRIDVKSGGITISIDVMQAAANVPGTIAVVRKADLPETLSSTEYFSLAEYDGAIHLISLNRGEWFKYDITADTWTMVSYNLPLVSGVCAFAVDNKFYIAGIEVTDVDSDLVIMRYDAASEEWTEVARQSYIYMQADLKFVIGDKAYINTPSFGFFAFNTVTDEIEPLESEAKQITRSIYGNYKGKGYGGQILRGVSLSEYDPATDTWTEGLKSISSFSDQQCFIDGSRLFYVDGAGVINMYDLEEKTTVKYDNAVVTPAERAAAIVVNGKAYIVGGVVGMEYIRTMYEITLP